MTPGARFSAVIEVLSELNEAWREGEPLPADVHLNRYFRERRFMGSKDRRYVGRMVYFSLRHGGALDWLLESVKLSPSPRHIAFLTLIFEDKLDRKAIEELCTGEGYAPKKPDIREQMLMEQFCGTDLYFREMPDWARYNCPEWLLEKFKSSLGETWPETLLALNEEAPVDLRANTLKSSVNDVIFALDKRSIPGQPAPRAAHGIRIPKRQPIFTVPEYKKGWFEVQDEGSQLVAALVEAKEGDTVIDLCAGAGGKSLAIAAQMNNKGRIIACDTNEKRLERMKARVARSGASNIERHVIQESNDSFLESHKASADWVVVDAPCSGTGTWRRNPDAKWRCTEADIASYSEQQRTILEQSVALAKPGGTLLYITCSLLSDENETQIRSFVKAHANLSLKPIPTSYQPYRQWVDGLGAVVRLLPDQHGTDGFFAALISVS